jgi:hypothetical protein
VNGTVNARGHGDHGSGWVDGSICIDAAGTATINGSGTINLKSKGSLLNISGVNDGMKLILDGVTLMGMVDNNQSLINVNNGGVFVMKNGKITGNHTDRGGGVGVYDKNTTFTMEGGEISGNSASVQGGGVRVWIATFTMEGGTISGNSAKEGGGIAVVGSDNDGSTFIMKGGTIYGFSTVGGNANTAPSGAVLSVGTGITKWGTGGTYTKGGVPQTGGSDIVPPPVVFPMPSTTDETLVAIPAQ